MIGKLKGIVDSIEEGYAIIDVGGVGYLVYASANTLRSFPGVGEAVSVVIETHVREDHIHLYGFIEESEREWFRILTTVKGVGTRMALAILSVLVPAQLVTALMSQDKASFIQVSGVGPKLADRILTELKDKTGTLPTSSANLSVIDGGGQVDGAVKDISDAVSALTNLGYGRSDAFMQVSKIAKDNAEMGVEDLIRNSLKGLGT